VGLVCLGVMILATVAGLAPLAVRAQIGVPGPCIVTGQRQVMPAEVPLGYSAQVTMSVSFGCPAASIDRRHVALALDASAATAGAANKLQRDAARVLAGHMAFPGAVDRQAGIVAYDAAATTLCQLTSNEQRLRTCISNVMLGAGGAAPEAGLREALNVLSRGRPRWPGPGEIGEVMILFSARPIATTCDAVLSAAAQVKGQRVLVISIAVGPDADEDCLSQASSSPRFFFHINNPSDIVRLMLGLRDVLGDSDVAQLSVTEALPPALQVEPETVYPLASVYRSRRIQWDHGLLPRGTYTMTYQITPLTIGEHVLGRQSRGELIDQQGQTWVFTFPEARIRAIAVPGLATPTPFPTRTPAAPSMADLAVCPGLTSRVPEALVVEALANPKRVGKFGETCRPLEAPGPLNPLKTWLRLNNQDKPYDPVFNGLVFGCTCH
jgi:hypothetical protein